MIALFGNSVLLILLRIFIGFYFNIAKGELCVNNLCCDSQKIGALISVNIALTVHTEWHICTCKLEYNCYYPFADMALTVALPLAGLETENFNSFRHIIDIAGLSQSQTSPSPSVSSESSGIGSLGSLKSESVNNDSLPSSPQTTEKVS